MKPASAGRGPAGAKWEEKDQKRLENGEYKYAGRT
jgi:hypothetical protein